MKTVRVGLLAAILGGCLCEAAAQSEVPPAAREVLTQLENEAADLERRTEIEVAKVRDKAIVALKKAQDDLVKDNKLDQALAVRDLVRRVEAGEAIALTAATPGPFRRAYRDFEEEMATLYEKAEEDFVKRRERVAGELKKIQDAFCKEAKLDEAVAVRDVIRSLREGRPTPAALPDPGYINNGVADIGKVFYYETTGILGGSIYGTDVYTTGSHLGTAALHCGLLQNNQKGVVRVTILPGQASYTASTRNGVTSSAYSNYNVSFKVERAYGFLHRVPAPVGGGGGPEPNPKATLGPGG